MNRWVKFLLGLILMLALLVVVLVKPVDRSPYENQDFYQTMQQRLDSLEAAYLPGPVGDLVTGYSAVSIVPGDTLEMAGFSARKPKTFIGLRDSVGIRTIVLDNGDRRVAIVTADLLIFHPEVSEAFFKHISSHGWDRHDLYLVATHTHSSIGQWAPRMGGEIISGKYNEEVVAWLVQKMSQSVLAAASMRRPSTMQLEQTNKPSHLINRLTSRGAVDDTFSTLLFQHDSTETGVHIFGAHPTCFSMRNRLLTGDYPSDLYRSLNFLDSANRHTPMFAAGAMASMGPPKWRELIGEERSNRLGFELAVDWWHRERCSKPESRIDISAFRLRIPMPEPQYKITRDFALRSWVFYALTGRHTPEISVIKIGNTLLMGFPADFSGELALPLYAEARQNSFDLLITSFNGGYVGYVIDDQWYDLAKYESRNMAWYGPYTGAYFSEISQRILEILAE